MPIVSPILSNPLMDGRQSERAMVIRRGVQRMLTEMGAHVLPELSLASGRRADLVALTRHGDIWIVEIKSSIEDFRVDRKWPDYRLHSDRFFFATHPEVPAGIFPGGMRIYPVRWLWRGNSARGAGASAAGGNTQGAIAENRACGRSPPPGRGVGGGCCSGSRRRERIERAL